MPPSFLLATFFLHLNLFKPLATLGSKKVLHFTCEPAQVKIYFLMPFIGYNLCQSLKEKALP